MDYEEIVEALRNCAGPAHCKVCKMYGCSELSCYDGLKLQAADAIEELSNSLDVLADANAKLREAVSDWISVEERLPIDPRSVGYNDEKQSPNLLVYTKEGAILMAVYRVLKTQGSEYAYFLYEGYPLDDVLLWMYPDAIMPKKGDAKNGN